MKVLVATKRVIDYLAKIRVNPAKNGVVQDNSVKMILNPFCEIATEAAVQLKEQKIATELVAVSIGPKGSQDTLRMALALGMDRGIHVTTDMKIDQELQPLAVAKALGKIVEKEKPDLVILGKQSIDGDFGQTGQMLAGILGWPQFTYANSIEFSEDRKSITVGREVDGGIQTIKGSLPSVITTDLRLNEPRYATLPNIMKSRKKPMEAIPLEDLGVDVTPRLETLSVEEPPTRSAGIIVEDVATLVDKLKNEAKVV
jgi:electron transfer flavoprotein beta subunit